jgi:membrane associated rhomboid family serine protease
MPSTCPDDGLPLKPERDGTFTCSRCGGALWSASDLDTRAPGVAALLALETDPNSGGHAYPRTCGDCGVPMVPWRIGESEAWLEKCPSCEHLWLERQDRRTVEMRGKQRARQAAYGTFDAKERRELAGGIAESVAELHEDPSAGPALSPFHALLVALGLPVVTRQEGSRTPWSTWTLALVLIAVHVLGAVGMGSEQWVETLGYVNTDPSALTLLTAQFAHFDVPHLVGNVFFLLAFGDGVEQRLRSAVLWTLFLGVGMGSFIVEGAAESQPLLIAGASGGIAALTGACIVLQPNAKVAVHVAHHVLELPLWFYGLLGLCYQGLMMAIGSGHVAWLAHIVGLVGGAAVAWRLQRQEWARAVLPAVGP